MMINELSFMLFLAVLVATFMACAAYIVFFINQKKSIRLLARRILIASGVLQTLYLITRMILAGYTPITTHHETVFFFCWATTWAYLSFRWRYTVKNFGTFVSILILILAVTSSLVSQDIIPLRPALQSYWLPVHAGVSLIAYGFLGLSFCGGLMYLLQEWELKSKRFGYFFTRLPSLDALDQLNSHCLTTGFAFLTLGIVTGTVWARQAWGTNWQWDPKEVWSVITWFIYLIQFHHRITVGWRGRRAAVMSIVGFCAVIITLCLIGGEHSYAQ
jgi:cytochrome c-type biogenesis protein CcsB